MSKYIRQLRYYKENDERNYPQNEKEGYISTNQLANPQFFSQYMPITQIGIQTLPGTKFYLNDISYVLPNDIVMNGFEEFILDYINSRNYIEIRENRLKKKLAKEKELDLILAETIRRMLASDKQTSKEEMMNK